MTRVLKIMHRDFKIVQKQYLLMTIALIIVFTLLDILSNSNNASMKMFWLSFTYFITMQAQYTNSKYDNISLSLPIKRYENVMSLYFSFFILFSSSPFIIGGLNKILYIYGLMPEANLINTAMGLTNFSSNVIVLGAFLPLYFKFGDFRKAITTLLLILVPFIVIAMILKKSDIVLLPNIQPSVFLIITGFIVLYFISMMISIKFYNKREF